MVFEFNRAGKGAKLKDVSRTGAKGAKMKNNIKEDYGLSGDTIK